MDPSKHKRKPKLDRRNALKNIDYNAAPTSAIRSRSLDIFPSSNRTSFRVEGIDGEFDRICRSLGLSGPDDFAIPEAAWEAQKARSFPKVLPRPRLHKQECPEPEEEPYEEDDEEEENEVGDRLSSRFAVRVRFSDEPCKDDKNGSARSNVFKDSVFVVRSSGNEPSKDDENESAYSNVFKDSVSVVGSSCNGGGGIKGVRPPVLAPPPSMSLPILDSTCSTWDIFNGFAPQDDRDSLSSLRCDGLSSSDEGHKAFEEGEGDGAIVRREEANGVRLQETVLLESCSLRMSNDDSCSSMIMDRMYNISPNGRFRHNIKSWQKGDRLGSGSFGTVYEAITDDGIFFAVKEVSLLDQGSQGKQSIYQLEQEIALLSLFEHENIVQYLGTDKDKAKLYIFLELVTKGSLASLYQKYHLQNSQVSAYTRQILNGLKYLHDQKVVHRDIKCANILVDASGSVKLADFGLAKATKLNDVKSCKGTAFWMAPEVVNRKNHGYGLAADIWSLGCTVLEMLTRQLPYSHLECMQALFRIGRGEPPPIPNDLSGDAQDFIFQCLQVNADDRPTAAELLEHPFVKRPLTASSGSVSPHTNYRKP